MPGPTTLLALLLGLLAATHGVQCSHITHTILPEAAVNPVITGWSSQETDPLPSQCSKWFETRRHMTAEEQQRVSQQPSWQGSHNASSTDAGWCPALLWTYTGTGNTMTRMLIEAASGYYTGSVYTGR